MKQFHAYYSVKKDEVALRNNKKYHTIDTNKNGVRFRNSNLRQLNDDYVSLKEDYNEQQKSVVTEIMNIACKWVSEFAIANILEFYVIEKIFKKNIPKK